MVPQASLADNAQSLTQRRLQILEDRVVREIFEAANLREALQDYRRESGGKALRLDVFGKRFPAFPIRLAVPAQNPEMIFRANLLWSSFKKSPLYAEYAAPRTKPSA